MRQLKLYQCAFDPFFSDFSILTIVKFLPTFCIAFFCCCFFTTVVPAQQPPVVKYEGPSTIVPVLPKADSVMVTVILKHQQDKNLPEIRRILEAQGFWDMFPPEDARVISWTIAAGLGHIVTLQLPANAVRRLNLALENGAWGAFETEVYMSYDYRPIWKDYIEKRADAKEERN